MQLLPVVYRIFQNLVNSSGRNTRTLTFGDYQRVTFRQRTNVKEGVPSRCQPTDYSSCNNTIYSRELGLNELEAWDLS